MNDHQNYRFRRDDGIVDDSAAFDGPSAFAFLGVLIFTGCVVAALLHLRRRRRQALLQQTLPQYHAPGHQRTLTIATSPLDARGEAIYVYDEKMNLIANSASTSAHSVPEIHVTFPDDDASPGEPRAGRVVVLRLSDTGSVGMEPLNRDPLPPYQHADAERFQSLDLDRIGGLKEKSDTQPRFS